MRGDTPPATCLGATRSVSRLAHLRHSHTGFRQLCYVPAWRTSDRCALRRRWSRDHRGAAPGRARPGIAPLREPSGGVDGARIARRRETGSTFCLANESPTKATSPPCEAALAFHFQAALERRISTAWDLRVSRSAARMVPLVSPRGAQNEL